MNYISSSLSILFSSQCCRLLTRVGTVLKGRVHFICLLFDIITRTVLFQLNKTFDNLFAMPSIEEGNLSYFELIRTLT